MLNLGRNVAKYSSPTNFSGIFELIRKTGGNISKFVNFSSIDYFNAGNGFCSLAVTASPASCLVDGTMSTAWRNLNDVNNYFDIDFMTSRFMIQSFEIITICNPPENLIVKGSNDRTTWKELFNEDLSLQANVNYTINVNSISSYRFFRFTTKKSYIHLSKIELYGILNPYMKCTDSFMRSSRISMMNICLCVLIQVC